MSLTHRKAIFIVENIDGAKSLLYLQSYKLVSCVYLPWRSLFVWYITYYCSLDRFNDKEILSTSQKEKQIERLNPWIVREKQNYRNLKFQMHTWRAKIRGISTFPLWLGFGPSINFLSTKIDLLPFDTTLVIVSTKWGIQAVPFGRTYWEKEHSKPLIWKHSNEDF